MLSPYRVLDCTDDRGHLAGMLLAQLGADVVLIEPPEGSGARRKGPYAGDQPGPDNGLWHWAYNRGKRSVAADLSTEAGRQRLRTLAASADVLLWSGRPGDLPLAYEQLADVNPGLVMVAMTPFGLEGPKADWVATDMVVCAAGCQLALTGNSDMPPLRIGAPQGYVHGAADMAVAAMIGLTERRRSGRGQLADVSAQVSVMQASFGYTINAAWNAPLMRRSGDSIDFGDYKVRWTYPAADGEVSITLLFGAAMKEFTANLFQWIWEEGGCDEATRDKPWEDLWVRIMSGLEPATEPDRLADVIAAFTSTRTKAELAAEARRRRVLLAPIATLTEVMENDHLAERGFWDVVRPAGALRDHRLPGRFVVASGSPLRPLAPPPMRGAHTDAVLAEANRPTASAGRTAEDAGAGAGDDHALAGLKVLDLTWSIAGPFVGRGLADFGATVVKVETHKRPDITRTASPFHPLADKHPMEGSGLHANTHAGKLGLELDLSTPEGAEVLWDLVRWADVVLESFSAGALERMGFGYARMAEVNPSVILLSTCLPGQTGSLELPGYGNLSTALFGFTSTTSWPGRSSSGPFGAYTDVISPRFGLLAVLAALDHRERMGLGQHLDLSQAEASLHFIAPALLDAEVNGRDVSAQGNSDAEMAPHGVYPLAGDDCWIAVACETDGEWRSLAAEMGRLDLAGMSTAERLVKRDELDQLVADWTRPQSGEELQAQLQKLGVSAHQVQNSPECLADPQLAHRGHYLTVEHHLLGPVLIEGPRFELRRTPGKTVAPGPSYGQHAQEVLGGLLGYDSDRIAVLAEAGALG
jgi:crotonobetainyl-CoA:carnitine CoA-transferase CaiB-like acyl-CoA transferase